MRRWRARAAATAVVIGAAVGAYAIGNGDIRPSTDVTIITITSATGGSTGTTLLENTTSATTYSVLVGSDASCDPALMFSVVGGNPVAISPMTNRTVNLTCPTRGSAAMRRCLYHATNNGTGTALADFMNVCLYGSSQTLAPQQTSLDFSSVVVGESAMLQLDLQNNAATSITRVYLQSTDLAGNFQFSTPCNPDAPFCDQDVMAVGQNGMLALQIKCTPQTPGMHTAQIYVGTNTFQLLAQPVTLTCMGVAATAPVLSVNPPMIDLPTPLEVISDDANVVVHVSNAGGGTLSVNDVRIVDVDAGAATNWTYTASGECTGVITSACSLEAGEQVDINLTFDPSALGRRRATLLISYKDTIDRTREIPLDGAGVGATLDLVGGTTSLAFGAVPVGRSSTLDFELVNSGTRDTTAQLAVASGTTPPFTVSPSATPLVPNVAKTISLTCTPGSATPFSTSVTAQAPDAFSGSPAIFTATCEGSALALFANPTALNLGEIRQGGGVQMHTIQLLSVNAPAQLTLSGQPVLESPAAGVTVGALNQTTTPASFELAIDPDQLPEGQLSLTISAEDTAGETLRIPVVGKVVVATYEVKPTVDLGTFCVGQATTSSNLSLVSDGTATIGLTQPTLGSSPSSFQLETTSPPAYPTTLAPGTTATVAITPQRQLVATQLDDSLTWHTDVADEQNALTTISARFIDQGGAIAPPALDFGEVIVHLYSDDGQRVVIQNCNPTPLQLDQPIIKSPFQLASVVPSLLAPNETATFSVGFHPTRIGVVTDTMRITSPQLPGAPLEVTLRGEGVTPKTMPPDAGTGSNALDDTSFYACSCKSTRPGGILPILIAIMCVLFPRRTASFSRRRRG